MSDLRGVINAHVSALVDGFYGCLDAAAETINARCGGSVCKGTLSKRMAGLHGWAVEDVIALEDASRRYPVTRMMARRLVGTDGGVAGCVISQAGWIAREAGEAVSAILAAQQSEQANDRVRAIAEIDEAVEALRRARATMEALQ